MTAVAQPDWLPAVLREHADAYASKADCDADRVARSDERDARYRRARVAVRDAGAAGVAGQCPLCARPRHFLSTDFDAAESNRREGLVCDGCGINARVRAGLFALRAACPDRDAPVYLTEQLSAAWLWLHAQYPRAVGSEFARSWWRRLLLSRHLAAMGGRGFVRYEDVTRLRFASASQRAVVSFDVLEHVPDHRAALREFARVTMPGGWLVLTAPFTGEARHLERARLRPDGSVEHLVPAEYHGDPLGKGVLCFHHFGWDLLDDLRDAGWRDAVVAYPWWPEAGLFDGLATIVARR